MLVRHFKQILNDTPESILNSPYFHNVFDSGIAPLIRVPRDVVRFTNTLRLTYSMVRRKVNFVDFIALEAIRVFLPNLYEVIRKNKDKFSGLCRNPEDTEDKNADQAFHQSWINQVPESLRTDTQKMLGYIFPKTNQERRQYLDFQWLNRQFRERRACHLSLFLVYFQFTLSSDLISHNEIIDLIKLTSSPTEFANALVRAKKEKYPRKKAQLLLTCLQDRVETGILDDNIPVIIQVLFNIGDLLIEQSKDPSDEFDIMLISSFVYNSLSKLSTNQRATVLEDAIKSGDAITVQLCLLLDLDKEITKVEGTNEPTTLLSANDLPCLKEAWLNRIRALSREDDFIKSIKLPALLNYWNQWTDGSEATKWCEHIIADDDGLLKFLSACLSYAKCWNISHQDAYLQPRINLKFLRTFIIDIDAIAKRLIQLIKKGYIPSEKKDIPREATEAVLQYLKEHSLIKEGKNLDNFETRQLLESVSHMDLSFWRNYRD